MNPKSLLNNSTIKTNSNRIGDNTEQEEVQGNSPPPIFYFPLGGLNNREESLVQEEPMDIEYLTVNNEIKTLIDNGLRDSCIKFKLQNLSGILQKHRMTVQYITEFIIFVCKQENQDSFQRFINLGFGESQISSILHGTGLSAIDMCQVLLKDENIEKIEIIVERRFEATSISSILNNSGKRLQKCIDQFIESLDLIEHFLEHCPDWNKKHFSSLMYGFGIDLKKHLNELVKEENINRINKLCKNKITHLIREFHRLPARNRSISVILDAFSDIWKSIPDNNESITSKDPECLQFSETLKSIPDNKASITSKYPECLQHTDKIELLLQAGFTATTLINILIMNDNVVTTLITLSNNIDLIQKAGILKLKKQFFIQKSIKELLNHIDQISALTRLGFSIDNIGSLIRRSTSKVQVIIQGLTNSIDNIERLMEIGFTRSNISSILNGSGANVQVAIQGLINSIDDIRLLLNSGLTPSNISHALHGAGANVQVAIQDMILNRS